MNVMHCTLHIAPLGLLLYGSRSSFLLHASWISWPVIVLISPGVAVLPEMVLAITSMAVPMLVRVWW